MVLLNKYLKSWSPYLLQMENQHIFHHVSAEDRTCAVERYVTQIYALLAPHTRENSTTRKSTLSVIQSLNLQQAANDTSVAYDNHRE